MARWLSALFYDAALAGSRAMSIIAMIDLLPQPAAVLRGRGLLMAVRSSPD